MTPQYDRSAYTVGWVCALHIEYTAAQVFLDEKHSPLDQDLPEGRDDNHYTLGAIGKHKVVIAVLPSGEYGTASAASVAKDLVRSFPNVRIGLMVGIGGGAPSHENDIRLGDIVVSTAGDGHSGVFQYDFGKTIQEKSFRHTRIMDQPPAVLRAAVSGIRSRYEIEGHALDTAIEEVLVAKKRLRKKYGKPDVASDLLFEPGFLHNDGVCHETCALDGANIVHRPQREEDEDDMQIHYGLVASANSLMKDARLRNQLSQDKNVLCFEMEAAGLMNTFPCLVIRGICDYSDSHKNKMWQGYAAMAAAAYAKALCLELKPTSIEKERKIFDVVSEVRDVTVAAHAGVREIRSNMEASEDRRILQWLSSEDYGAQHSDILQARCHGTGQWFLESEAYQRWKAGSQQTLFCPGIPGAGKTIMTSIAIDDIMRMQDSNPRLGIAFIYCNFKRQVTQGLERLLGSVLRRLCSCLPTAPEGVRKLFSEHEDKGTRITLVQLKASLRDVIKSFDRTYIFVDALDECQAEDGSQSQLPMVLFDLQRDADLNIFATSRHIPNITKVFNDTPCLEIAASTDDLTGYMHENMARLPEFVRDNDTLQSEILRNVIAASQGMFLIAKLHINSLVDKHNVRSLRDALKKLHGVVGNSTDISRTTLLRTAYSDVLDRIRGQLPGFRQLAERVLVWVTLGRQQFKVKELQAVVATRVGETIFDMDNITDINILMSVCCGLVILQSESNEVQLVHYTAQDYLDENREVLFPEALSMVANECITHLMYELPKEERRVDSPHAFHLSSPPGTLPTTIDFITTTTTTTSSSDTCSDNHSDAYSSTHSYTEPNADSNGEPMSVEACLRNDCLAPVDTLRLYSSCHWGVHVLNAEAAGARINSVDQFLHSVEHVVAAAVRLCRSPSIGRVVYERTPEEPIDTSDYKPFPNLHILTFFGLLDRVTDLLQADPGVETTPGLVDKPFLFRGYSRYHAPTSPWESKLRLLDPLHFAICGSQLEVIETLLKSGACLQSKGRLLGSPLAWAAGLGNEEVVDLLIRSGARVDGEVEADEDGAYEDGFLWYQPLICAVEANALAVVKLLVTNGADLNTSTNYEQETSLHIAAAKGFHDIVKYLIDSGADIYHECILGKTALIAVVDKWLTSEVNTEILKLLTRDHEDIDHVDSSGNTALSRAMYYSHLEAAQVLLDAGASVGIRGNEMFDPLEEACQEGRPDVIHFLLQNDQTRLSNVFAKVAWPRWPWSRLNSGRSLSSPVELAAVHGHQDVLWALLSSAPKRPSKFNRRRRHIIDVAVRAGQIECAKMVAFYFVDNPEMELFSPALLRIADRLDSYPTWLRNIIQSDPGVLSRESNGNRALLLISKWMRSKRLLHCIANGATLALEISRFHLDAEPTTSILLGEGMNADYEGSQRWTAREFAGKCEGDDMSAFVETLGVDPFHWRVLSENALTWYSTDDYSLE